MGRLSNVELIDQLLSLLRQANLPDAQKRTIWELIKDIDSRLNPRPPQREPHEQKGV
jgi:hypothetical protein